LLWLSLFLKNILLFRVMNAIVTGATKGIGKAIALRLAEAGYNLAVCARTEADLVVLAGNLAYTGVKVLCITTDLSIKEQVCRFAAEVGTAFDTIDVLVNNAGVFIPGSVMQEEDNSFEQQLFLNLNAPYYLAKYFGKMMSEQASGHIFNICSVSSKEINENAGSYGVTKSALLSLNNVLRQELSKYNVKVTAILPGSTITPSWEGTNIPAERFVQPEDIANALHTILNLSSGVNVEEIILKPLNFNA
jgi:3-oxoacyl-[acyl-carrier protein] reductase